MLSNLLRSCPGAPSHNTLDGSMLVVNLSLEIPTTIHRRMPCPATKSSISLGTFTGSGSGGGVAADAPYIVLPSDRTS